MNAADTATTTTPLSDEEAAGGESDVADAPEATGGSSARADADASSPTAGEVVETVPSGTPEPADDSFPAGDLPAPGTGG